MFPTFREGARFIAKKNPYHAVTDIQRDIIVFRWRSPRVSMTSCGVLWGCLATRSRFWGRMMVNGQTLKHEWVRQEGVW